MDVERWRSRRAYVVSGQKTISLPELLELRAKDGVAFGKYVSVERGRALLEIVTEEATCTVTVVDPATEVDPEK